MRNLKNACLCASVATTLVLASCTTGKQTTAHNTSRKPRFIDSLTLAGNSNSQVRTATGSNSYTSNTISGSNTKLRKYDPATTNVLQAKYADMLSSKPQNITNIALYSFIDEWYGVRYKMGGNDKSGIDCSAFVQRLYENVFGTNLVRTAFEQFNTCAMNCGKEDLKEGDLVFFYSYTYARTGRGRHRKMKVSGKRISHVGVYLANDRFVHASTSQGVMISSLKEEYWSQKYAGAGQVPRS